MSEPNDILVADPADILAAGDSWATLSVEAIRTVSGEVVRDISIGGSTAMMWRQERGAVPSLLDEALESGVHTVYLSIGALDGPIEGSTDFQIAHNIQAVILPVLRNGIRVVQAGYNDPWFPRFHKLMAAFDYEESLYSYIDLTHMNPDVTLLPDLLHLAPENYLARVEYCWWWLGESPEDRQTS